MFLPNVLFLFFMFLKYGSSLYSNISRNLVIIVFIVNNTTLLETIGGGTSEVDTLGGAITRSRLQNYAEIEKQR